MNDVDNGGGYACMGAGGNGNSLYVPFNFTAIKKVFKTVILKSL